MSSESLVSQTMPAAPVILGRDDNRPSLTVERAAFLAEIAHLQGRRDDAFRLVELANRLAEQASLRQSTMVEGILRFTQVPQSGSSQAGIDDVE